MSRIPFVLLCLLIFLSCRNTGGDKSKDILESAEQEEITAPASSEYVKKAKFIFYNMSSPIEMAQIFENSGTDFNVNLLYDHSNYTNYLSSKKIAMILGLYCVELSYARMYNQTQLSVNYLSVIKKLTEKLGVPDDYVTLTPSNIENNINNRDSLFKIANDAYQAADTYLKGNERQTTASLILTGGWVEALYIAVSLLDPENPDNDLMKKIAEQKYSLNSLVTLLKNEPEDDELTTFVTYLESLKKELQNFEDAIKELERADDVLPLDANEDNRAEYITSIQDKMLTIRNQITS